MTKDEIIEMVMQIGGCDRPEDDSPALKMFETFAKLVAEKEREACADMIEDFENIDWNIWDCAKAIRERGNELCRLKGGDAKTVPLYTHPVKDLEDIDINITWNENSMRDFGKDELNFARAIEKRIKNGN